MKKKTKKDKKKFRKKFWYFIFQRIPEKWLFYMGLILPDFIKRPLRKYLPKRPPSNPPYLNWFTLMVLAWQTLRREGVKVLLYRIKLYHRQRQNQRSAFSIQGKPHNPNPSKFSVLFIAPEDNIHSKRYRVDNIIEQLKIEGIKTLSLNTSQINSNLKELPNYDLWVFFRLGMSPLLATLFRIATQLKIIPILDFDDYIFDPKMAKHISLLKKYSHLERKCWIEMMRLYQKSFQTFRYLTLSTSFLVKITAGVGKKSFLIPNGVNQKQIKISKKALTQRLKKLDRHKALNIGYFSGTQTHQRDFEEVAPVLLKILQEFPNVNFCYGGYLDLDKKFSLFPKQIKKLPFVPWQNLPYNLAKIDINLAPLELNNPFNEAKSELKYFEAALLKIPTIASATQSFKDAIKSGRNGFLAEDSSDWYKWLKLLIQNSGLRKKIGEKAFIHTMNNYTPRVLAPKTKRVYHEIIKDWKEWQRIKNE